jgi:hypothetical protein
LICGTISPWPKPHAQLRVNSSLTKPFSTGSFGWYLNGKTVIEIDGKAVSVQIGMNMTVVGSKEAT